MALLPGPINPSKILVAIRMKYCRAWLTTRPIWLKIANLSLLGRARRYSFFNAVAFSNSSKLGK